MDEMLHRDHKEGNNMDRNLEKITSSSTEEPQNILYSEVEETMRTVKRNKSSRSDETTVEMIQADGEQLVQQKSLAM